MRLRLNLSLRRALMAAMTVATTLVSPAYGGVVDSRYDLQYYMDFCRNKGMFAAGATNIEVYYKDGTHIDNNVIPLMPNMDSYGQTVSEIISIPGTASQITSNGGTNLVSAQFLYGAKHVHLNVGNTSVAFLSENAAPTCVYSGANLDTFGTDSAMQRLTKLVTAVAYTPLADDAFMSTLKLNETWLYRTGNGGTWCEGKAIGTANNALGGVVNLSTCWQDSNTGEWYLEGWTRTADTSSDTRTPLDVGVYLGDSGSPYFAWDDANNRFVFVGALFASNAHTAFPSWHIMRYNYQQASAVMDKYFVSASFSGTDTIVWSASDAVSGKGTLTQNDVTVEYTGKGSGNTLADSLGLMFSSESSETQVLQLQGNVNMGAGALTFESGQWRLTEQENADYSLTGAGFEIKKGAEVTWELTGSSSQEIRKVGEGVLTISGSGNNDSSLVVGGGSTVYNIVRDDAGNIIGCTLGNAGETRLNRENGYAASSVRLEGGVAIIVLMADNQFKTNSVQGDTFSFGNDGGLLNLNGHDLTWGVINQDGSGTGARIGNFTPEGMDTTPSTATFTYTGTGTFAGCFMDEGPDKAQLKVAYNHASGGQWTLTGQHSNAGGFVVQAGTMALQGSLTPHVNMSDGHDWTYATLESSGGVTIENGATFRLSHHALMSADVTVNLGATFIVNHTANAVSESISGSRRMDMRGDSGYGLLTSFKGNVALSGSMVVDTGSSPVMTSMQGNITGTGTLTKRGSGNYFVDGAVNISSGTVETGGLIIRCNLEQFGGSWTIKEQGYLGVEGVNGADLLRFVSTDSSGVLALGADQTEALDLSSHQNLYIGALGTLNYGSADKELAANGNKQWLLGGGGGTLNVLFRLTGENDLIIGNDYSGGTVHLSNIDNDFTGDIYIKGTGNILTYATDTETGNTALGTARVALSYGNTLGLNDPSQLSVLREGAQGVLALTKDMSLDLTGKPLSVGAAGALTLTSELTVGDVYRFGGQGDLTIDTNLASAAAMELDGQGNSGSSVTFARNDAFSGVITAGGGLHLEDANSSGDIGIHVSNEYALAAAEAIELQKGATLYTDGGNLVVHNLSATTGSAIKNNGTTASMLQLNIDEGVSATIENGVLSNTYFVNDAGDDVLANLHIVKTGKGTVNMGGNTSWSGGLTIMEGQVNASIANGGIGAAGSAIYVTDGASLQLTSKQFGAYDYRELASTVLPQKLSGDGEVSISNGNDMLFMTQAAGFEGTIKVTGNTRLYITESALIQLNEVYSTSQAFDNATIVVESGSQARLTPSIYCLSGTAVQSWADYVISGGADFLGNSSGLVQSQHNGALVVDGLATVWGNVTLADDAMIASWSHDPSVNQNYAGSYAYRCLTTGNYANRYGIINKLGGIIRGQILGEVEEDGTMTDLTIGGTEGITITADSANTFEDLIIANGNSKNYNSDLIFALRLDGGEAISKTSTALGTGTVSLNDGLILRLAGTGASNSDIVYTYENAINTGDGATLQSYYITNRLTGTVTMQGDELNLATANGGVLELVGGISGSGTLNVAAGSKVILGSAAAGYALARTGGAAFSGTVATAAGSDITLASPAVVANDTVFTGTDSLTLRLGGAEDFTFGRISLTGSQVTGDEVTTTTSTTLNLYFDFTNVPDASDQGTWNTLTVTEGITADSVTIALDLNMFGDMKKGSYTLISEAEENTAYSLADTMNNRLSLSTESGTVVLTVGDDERLYWRTDGVSEVWNTTDANWYSDATSASGYTPFAANADVMLDSSGVAEGNGPDARETISLSDTLTVGTIGVKDAAYEVTGTGSLSGSTLTVGNGGDLKLSNAGGNTFTNGVLVSGENSMLESAVNMAADITAENGSTYTQSGGKLTGDIVVSDAFVNINNAELEGAVKAIGTGSLSLSNAKIIGARTITFDSGNLTTGSTLTLGGTFSFATGQTALNATGMSINVGALTTTTALDVDSLAMNSASLTLTHAAGTTTEIDNVTGNGSLNKNTSGNLNLGSAQLWGMELKGGGLTTISGTVNVTNVSLSVGKETLNLVNGANVTTVGFTSGNTAQNQSSLITISSGASLTITGSKDNNGEANNDTHSTKNSFLLAHWSSSASKMVLDGGTLTALNTRMMMGWDSGGTFEVKAGTANLKGIRFVTERGHADTLLLGTADSGTGRINIGVSGIAGIDSNDTVTLGNGTIGALADFAISNKSGQGKAIDFVGKTGTVFDTAGHTITVNTAINGSGNIIKQGAGTLKLHSSADTFSGNIDVQSGALAVNTTGISALENAASVSIGSGATLDLSAVDFTDASNSIDVGYGHGISFAADSTVAFANMDADKEYGIFNFSGGLVEGWTNLKADNFSVDGVNLANMGRVEITLGMTGTFSYSIESWDLVWNGGASGDWNLSTDAWQTTRPDASTGEDVTIATTFTNNDNAIFNTTASLKVSEGMMANNVTITNNSTVTLDGSALEANLVTIESGSKLKGAYASALTSIKAYNIAAGAELEAYVPGTPTFNAEVTGDGAVTMTGGGTLTWNAADGSLSIAELNITGGGTFKTSSAYTGTTVNITDGSAQFEGNVAIGTMNVAADKTVTLVNKTADAGNDKHIGLLQMGDGATLTFNNSESGSTTDAGVIKNLQLAGTTAKINETNHSGHLKIETLSLAEGVSSATLSLEKASNPAAANYTAIFELGSSTADRGNFVGIVDLSQKYSHSGAEGHKQSVFLTLSGAETLANAVVQMNTQPGTKAYLGLGINAHDAKIAGLVSSQTLGSRVLLFSGYAPDDIQWHTDLGADFNADEVARTLYINTAANQAYTYYGQVREMLSIVKQGEGTQAFYGQSDAFNGSIDVQGGTLAFNASSAGMLSTASAVGVSGGSLKLLANEATTYGTAEGTVTMAGGSLQMEGAGELVLNSKLVVNDSSTLLNATTAADGVLNRAVSAVEIKEGKTLWLRTVPADLAASNSKGAVKWSISNLSGAGTLQWDSFSYHNSKSSHLVLSGDGSQFTGEVYLNRTFDQSEGKYQTYIEIASADAVKNATVKLAGNQTNGQAALAINTKNTQLKGLIGNEHTHLYAGAALEDKGLTTPGSTANNTLTIAGDAAYTFAGTVGTASESSHLNIAMNGSGTQTFSGVANVGDVSVSNGKLSFTNNSSVAHGVVSVDGGTLQLSSANLLEGASSFTLSSNGVLDLSAITFGTDAANAISLASGATYTFSGGVIDLGALEVNSIYQIFDTTSGGALQGWTGLTLENFSLAGEAMTDIEGATLMLGADGTFSYTMTEREAQTLYWSNAAGNNVWSASSKNWNTAEDATSGATLDFNNADSVVFGSTAEVSVQGALQATSMRVADNATVTLTLNADAELTMNETELGSGSTLSVSNPTDTEVTISNITGGGTLVKTGSGTLNLGDAELNTLDFTRHDDSYAQSVGALNITGTVNVEELLRVGDGTLTIGDTAAVTTKIFQAVSNGKNANSRIEINGGSLTITGTDDVDDEATDFILGYWHNSTTTYAQLTLNDGSLTAENTSLYMGYDSPGVFKALGGEATLKGIRFRANEADADTFELGTATSATDSVTVTIGSTGIVGMAGNDVIKLGGGTLKASADFAITAQSGATPSVSLMGTTSGTVFDTNGHNITVNTALTGSGKLVKNSTGKLIFTAANTYSGATTINAGSIVLSLGTTTNDTGETVNRTYTLSGTVDGIGTLEVATGTTLAVANDKTISSALLVNGGVVNVTANNNQVMAGNITVQNGGELKFSYTGASDRYDCFVIGNTARAITLKNGTLDLGAMRHTMQNWSITMQDGSTIAGTGSSWNNNHPAAALDVATNGMTITVLENSSDAITESNEISAVTRLRTNNLKYSVASGASLTVSGLIMSDGSNPSITKEGAGDLIFTRDHTFAGTTTISAGKLVLDLGTVTTGEGENAVTTNGIYTLDGAVNGAGTLQVMGGTTVVADAAAETISTAVILEKGSVLKLDNDITNTLSKDVIKGTNGAGTLQVESGTTLANNSKTISADLVLNGGNATLKGANKQIQGNVTVNDGSTLTFDEASTSDTLNYGGTQTLTVNDGGTVDFQSTRQTMGGWTIELNGGEIKGSGQDQYGAIDYHNVADAGHVINALSGNSLISADIRLRYKDNSANKQDVKLKYDVAEGATLTMSGQVHSDTKTTSVATTAGYGSVIKEGAGKLIMTAANTYGGTTTISAGTLELQGAGKLGAGDVSIAAGGAALSAASTATVDEDGNVTAESEEWARMSSASDTAAAAVSGATITQTEDSKTLAVASRSTDGTRGTMANTLVQIAADATLTVDSMIISSGSQISGTAARAAARAAESSLAQVQLSNSIVQPDASNSTVADAPVTMDLGTLQATGSSDASGALTLGAASKVLTVSTDVFSNLALTSGTNFVVDFSSLLSRVDVSDADFVYLSFADTVSADWSTTTLTGTWNDYQMEAYYHTAVAVGAAVPNVGVYFDVRAIPEPTSTTLSLLALAALAARRRRK